VLFIYFLLLFSRMFLLNKHWGKLSACDIILYYGMIKAAESLQRTNSPDYLPLVLVCMAVRINS